MAKHNVSITVEVDGCANEEGAARTALASISQCWKGIPVSAEVNIAVHKPGVSGLGQQIPLSTLIPAKGTNLDKVILVEIDALCRQLACRQLSTGQQQ